MAGSLPWSQNAPRGPTNDPTELLRRIEMNTATLVTWMKILVVAVFALVVLTALIL